MNRLAGAGLRANPGAYRSLAAGIFLSLFLVSFVCLAVQGAAASLRAKQTDRLGAEDAILFDCPISDGELRESGWFDTIARVGVTGSVAEGAKHLGWYDEDAARLLRRRVIAGRLPEQPGELAAEEGALEMLEIAAELGATVELTITPIDGAPETRAYTLVGVLPEQAGLLTVSGTYFSYNSDGTTAVMQMPALVVSPEDAPFQTGRTVLHRVMTLRPGRGVRAMLRSTDQILRDEYQNDEGRLVGVARYDGGLVTRWIGSDSPFDGDSPIRSMTVICALWLGVSLVIAACVGVAGAMESRLAARLEEIGMLRAVGATRRQIRRIFGREAWILAALTAPAALGCACLCAFLLARIAPAAFAFRPTLALLAPILVLSVATILLSAYLPLRRAAKTMPMQVLRDARLIRRMRGRSGRGDFSPARLIALRQTFLHPARLVGPALLVGVMLFMVFLAATGVQAVLPGEHSAGFYLQGQNSWGGQYFQGIAEPLLSEGDIAQLRALPGVGGVRVDYDVSVDLLLDRVTEYFLGGEAEGFLSSAEALRLDNGWPDESMDWSVRQDAMEMWAAQQLLGTEKKLWPIGVKIVDEIPDAWREALVEGRVDRAALDSGAEVLVYAPDYYTRTYGHSVVIAPYPVDARYTLSSRNDYFAVGQTLAFTQLVCPDWEGMAVRSDEPESLREFYASLGRHDASVRVGGLLRGRAGDLWGMCLITTERGARALGLDLRSINNLTVDLASEPSPEREEALERRVAGIAARGNLQVTNMMRAYRERLEEKRAAFLTLLSASLVFLAAAVGMLSGNVKRRIAADARAIGTLRAVGASREVLGRCYSGQVTASLAVGAVIGAAAIAALALSGMIVGARSVLPAAVGADLLFLACAWTACAVILRRSLNAVVRRSIIENIREL